jgi:hypothetical protein
MNEDIIDFFKDQRRNPLSSRFLDLEKTALVLHRVEYQGKVYEGTQDWVDVSHQGKNGKMTRAMLGKPALEVVAAGSVLRKWRSEHKVQLLCDESYESGPYDVFAMPKGCRGFQPWDPVEDHLWAPRLAPTKYDQFWTPVRRYTHNWMKGGNWSELFYLPWWICQKMPMKDEPTSQRPTLVIDLSEFLQTQMVTNAY